MDAHVSVKCECPKTAIFGQTVQRIRLSIDRMPVKQKSFWKNISSRENNGSISRIQLPYHGAAEQPAQPRTPPGPARCDQSREEMPGIPVRRAGCRAGVCWRIGARGGCGSGMVSGARCEVVQRGLAGGSEQVQLLARCCFTARSSPM